MAFFAVSAATIVAVLAILPPSFVQQLEFPLDNAYLQFVGWLLPLDFYFMVGTLWLNAMSILFGVKFVMRKLNMIS